MTCNKISSQLSFDFFWFSHFYNRHFHKYAHPDAALTSWKSFWRSHRRSFLTAQHVERTSCLRAVTRDVLIHCFQSLAHMFYHLGLGRGPRNRCETHRPLTCCRVGVNVAEIQINAARYDAEHLDSEARRTDGAYCRKQWLPLCFCTKNASLNVIFYFPSRKQKVFFKN